MTTSANNTGELIMMNTLKELISWDKYNSPSTLFLYFIQTYGDDNIKYKKSINTCELVWTTISSLGTFIAVWAVAGILSTFLFWYLMFIALWLGVGFDLATNSGEPMVAFFALNGIAIFVGLVVGWAEFKDWRREQKYKEYLARQEAEEDGTYVEKPKGIFEEWFDSVHNKFCVSIDLNKFRPANKQVVKDLYTESDWE